MKEVTIDGVTYTACTNKFCSEISVEYKRGTLTIEPFVVQSFKESFNDKDHSVLVSTEIKEK